MIVIFISILIISLILALRSMKDFSVPNELKRLVSNKKIKGSILFLKHKTIHYKGKR